MEIKDKIEEIIEKIKNDKTLAEDFKKDPVKTVEGLLGVDLPDEAVKGIIEGVKAKINLDSAENIFGSIKNMFK
ncbi:MAG: hypothetical protein RSB36_00745 [Hydrogenoanaerobacterium sp.]